MIQTASFGPLQNEVKPVRKRPGRKRKLGYRRNGRLVHDSIGPTPELKAHRERMVGTGNDPTKASSASDVLHARGIIDDDSLRACQWFEYLFLRTHGNPRPTSGRPMTAAPWERVSVQKCREGFNFATDPAGKAQQNRGTSLLRSAAHPAVCIDPTLQWSFLLAPRCGRCVD